MAMEIRRTITSPDGSPAHDGQILCIAFNPLRKEISTGSQDTTIKTWVSETGDYVRTLNEHKGWVTGLVYAASHKVLFSCSIDGRVLVWNKGELLQKERVGAAQGRGDVEVPPSVKPGPLHCLAWDARRNNLVVGANGHIWVYAAIPEFEMTPTCKNVIKLQALLRDAHAARGSEDALVRGIITTESGKLYSVGHDRMLCMWDTDGSRKISEKPKKGKAKGNDGSGSLTMDVPQLRKVGSPVTCHDAAISAVTFDPDNNWVITGSFDRQVKIWAGDGKKPVAVIDEKTGIDDTVTGLVYCPATKTLWMASNSASPLVYDPRSATDITPYLQQTDTSAHAQKEAKDRVQRLFRIQQTGELVETTSSRNLKIWRYNPHGATTILRAHTDWVEVLAHCYKKKRSADGTDDGEEDSMTLFSGGADSVIRRWEPASRMNPSIYTPTDAMPGHTGAVLCAIYCEELDRFATGGDDGIVRLWPVGDASGVEEDEEAPASGQPMLGTENAVCFGTGLPEGPGHTDRVTGLICVGTTIGSVSWDLSIRLWDVHAAMRDLQNGEEAKPSHVLLDAHDDYILSVAHAPELSPPQMATASADQGIKLWDLERDTDPTPQQLGGPPKSEVDEDGPREMTVPEGRRGKALCGTLLGHQADVSHVRWNTPHALWVSGSEDHSVRLWSPLGVQVGEIRPPGDIAITALTCDARGMVLVATMDRAVRVYDPKPRVRNPALAGLCKWPMDPEMVQQHLGHADAVRCMLHVPEKEQYLTASWDRTIRVWRDYQPPPVPPEELAGDEEGEEGEEGEEAADADAGATSAAEEVDDEDDLEENARAEVPPEDVFEPYSVRHPLIEPKWIAEAKKGGGDKFMRKVSNEDDKKKRKKGADDDGAAKNVTGLGLELQRLEERLRSDLRLEPAAKPADSKRGSMRGRAAAGRR